MPVASPRFFSKNQASVGAIVWLPKKPKPSAVTMPKVTKNAACD